MALNREFNWESLSTLLEFVLEQWSRAALHTAMPGIIDSYDPETRRARVRPALRLVMSGEEPGQDGAAIERALIVDVPVMWPAGSIYTTLFPLDPGDRGMLVFSERGMTEFLLTGDLAMPDKDRFFDESDGVFFPSDFGHPRATPASLTGAVIQTHDGRRSVRVEADSVELHCGNSYVQITEDEIVFNAPQYRAL